METIAITIQKGGTGKTTTSSALASGLTAAGQRVLLVDMDPQQNLSYSSGVDVLDIPCTLYDVWKGNRRIQDAIQTVNLQTDIITGGLALASADFEFSGTVGREQLLKRSISQVSDRYDYCILDCPPSLGLLTMTALTAADKVIIPMTVDALAIQGLAHLWGFIQNVKEYCNPGLIVSGILLTMYEPGTITTKALESQIVSFADQAGIRLFHARIRKSQAIRTAQAQQSTDIYNRTAQVKAAADYRLFVAELMTMKESEEK